jgi:release factor glutamine methyltransferase
MIYQSAEDSYLLENAVKDYLKDKDKNIKILDMGSGSGIQAQTCKNLGFKHILCADISQEAVNQLKKQGFRAVKTYLFLDINPKTKFDLIIFNPPYLPEHKYDKEKDTTGGKKGYETIIDFLEQAKSHLNKDASILLLFSSLSQPRIIINKAKDYLGYNMKLLSSKNLFFEELFVYEFKIR